MKEIKVVGLTLMLYIGIFINLATIRNTFKYGRTTNLIIVAIWLSYRITKQTIKIITKVVD